MLRKLDREILKCILKLSLTERKISHMNIAKELLCDINIIKKRLEYLRKKGYVDYDNKLTRKGRSSIKVGLLGGVFDILHIGHIRTIKTAKSLVDILIVVIARNRTVMAFKGRMPINDEKDRLALVNSLKYVDLAILGSEMDFMEPVKRVNPDVIILGYDQALPPSLGDKIPKDKIVRLNEVVENVKTSRIIDKIKNLKL